MTVKLEITEYPVLLALHRVIMEAKFNPSVNDKLILGSPFVAKIANQVAEAIIESEVLNGDEAARDRWVNWSQLTPHRREWAITILHILDHRDSWNSLDSEKKREFATLFLSPFSLTEEMLNEFIRQVDEHSQTSDDE